MEWPAQVVRRGRRAQVVWLVGPALLDLPARPEQLERGGSLAAREPAGRQVRPARERAEQPAKMEAAAKRERAAPVETAELRAAVRRVRVAQAAEPREPEEAKVAPEARRVRQCATPVKRRPVAGEAAAVVAQVAAEVPAVLALVERRAARERDP